MTLAQQKMSAYVGLLTLRYCNLCVKADAGSLLAADIDVEGSQSELENVADVAMPDDYHLQVFPKRDIYIQPIARGIFECHPEFKVEVLLMDLAGNVKDPQDEREEGDRQFLYYTMPEVDKDRRDLLTGGVKGLYDECKARIDALNVEYKGKLAAKGAAVSTKEDMDEAYNALKENYEKACDMIRQQEQDKLDEIEEGYQRYLKEHPGAAASDDGGYDVTQGMKMR